MWENLNTIDVTSAFVGITTPVSEIIGKIAEFGWNVDNVDFKKNSFVATGSNDHGEKVEATGNTQATALGNLLGIIQRQHMTRMPFNARVAAWQDTSFVDLLEEIAHEYSEAKMYDKKAAGAWMELAEDCRRRVEIIKDEIQIEITDDPTPYASFSDMAKDILEKQHLLVSRAGAEHPIWSINQVVDFRIAHDILGHAASGGDWSWFGINRAFEAHAPLLTYTAQKALFTEVIGQGAAGQYYRSYPQQKIAFLKIFDDPDNPEPYHHPVHPSQTVIPGAMAKIPNDVNFDRTSSLDDFVDPNDGYQTGVSPLPNNGYAWHRIPDNNGVMVDPLNSTGLSNVVNQIQSNWHELDEGSQQQAVANAFRNALLKPGKHERGHAQHYQAINHMPASLDDPSRYWQALTGARDAHNLSRGYLQANKEIDPFIMPLRRYIQGVNPDYKHDQVSNLTDHHMLNMRAEEEKAAKKKLGKDASAEDIHREATKRLLKRLKQITNAKVNQDYDFANQNPVLSTKHPDPSIYPSPLAHHIEPISNISKNIQNVTRSAVEDMEKGGKGHHFRSSLMKKDFARDLDPNQIDEAWYYLAPETSQLGIITPEILKIMGRKNDDLNLRDYFKAERELQAGRDASGYGHMPLGQFSKGLKNASYQEGGHHPSKEHLHPIIPKPHTEVNWDKRQPKAEKPKIPGWFNDTKKARKAVGDQWDKSEAIKHPKGAIPFKKKTAGGFSTILMPFYDDPNSGERVSGKPNQSLMQHIIESMALDGSDISTPEVWALDPNVGKEVNVNGGN